MQSWWAADILNQPNGPIVLASWIIWVIGSIVLHELGHGWAAIVCGDDTPRWSGHMTWNPIVHMGWPSLLMFAIVGIAWGAMPVNPSRFKGRYDDALVALAGPTMNIALAVLAIVLYGLWLGIGGGYWLPYRANPEFYQMVFTFLRVGIMLNIALALFNLVPVPPLDGSRVLASYVPEFGLWMTTEVGRIVTLVLVICMFMFGGSYLFSVAAKARDRALSEVRQIVIPASSSPSGGGGGNGVPRGRSNGP